MPPLTQNAKTSPATTADSAPSRSSLLMQQRQNYQKEVSPNTSYAPALPFRVEPHSNGLRITNVSPGYEEQFPPGSIITQISTAKGNKTPVILRTPQALESYLRQHKGENLYISLQDPGNVPSTIIWKNNHSSAAMNATLGIATKVVHVSGSTVPAGDLFSGQPEGGFKVTSIAPNSPAAKAGLKPGDVIHGVNGNVLYVTEGITDISQLRRMLLDIRPNQPIKLTVSRLHRTPFSNFNAEKLDEKSTREITLTPKGGTFSPDREKGSY